MWNIIIIRNVYNNYTLQHCTVERISLPSEESSELFTFNVSVKGGKTHVFAAVDEQELQTWVKMLQVHLHMCIYVTSCVSLCVCTM